MGPAKLCLNISRQTWAFVLPPKEDFWPLLPFVNHVYTTEILGKEQKTLCKRLQMKHYHDKGLLVWLDSGMASAPPPQIVLDKQIGPEQWDIWKLAASTEELGT